MMDEIFLALGFVILGYLFGSLPFALWITKLVKGVDVRDAGSGHVSTTNTIRQAGWVAGIFVLILDITKGFIPTLLAYKFAPYSWVVPIVGAFAVAGHCWPIFAQFRGGMGLATAGGCMIAIFPLGLAIGLMVLLPLTLIIKHAARASLFASLLFAPVFYLLGERGINVGLAAAMGVILAVRFTVDWNREYRELWLDRDPT
jgi:glycerol-3-phosphate acyltransferase PlsY